MVCGFFCGYILWLCAADASGVTIFFKRILSLFLLTHLANHLLLIPYSIIHVQGNLPRGLVAAIFLHVTMMKWLLIFVAATQNRPYGRS